MFNLIFFRGSDDLANQLAGYSITDNPSNACCAVIEMPGSLSSLEQISGIPVLVVTTGMLTYREAKAIRQPGYISVQPGQLIEEVNKIIGTNQIISSSEDDMFFIFEETSQPVSKPNAPVIPTPIQAPPAPPTEPKPRFTVPINTAANKPNTPVIQVAQPPEFIQQKSEPVSQIKPQLQRDIETPAILQRRNGRKAPIAVSFSAGGGVGKTTVASNIACYTSLLGIPTVAMDVDLGYGDLDTATGLVDPINRTKVIDKKAIVPSDGWLTVSDWRRYAVTMKQNILQHNSKMYVIPAYPYAGNDISESEIEDLLYTATENFGFVVVDLGVDGFSPHARVALRMADVVMMVGGQDEKTIGKISQFLKQEGGYSNKMSFVVNKKSPTGHYTPKEVAQKLGFDTYYEIPLDEKGVNAAKKQQKLVVQMPGSLAGDAIKRYAAEILPFKLDAPALEKNPAGFMQKIKGLFKKG